MATERFFVAAQDRVWLSRTELEILLGTTHLACVYLASGKSTSSWRDGRFRIRNKTSTTNWGNQVTVDSEEFVDNLVEQNLWVYRVRGQAPDRLKIGYAPKPGTEHRTPFVRSVGWPPRRN